jgi:hypothetical protein
MRREFVKESKAMATTIERHRFLLALVAVISCIVILSSCERREAENMRTSDEPARIDLREYRWKNRLVLIFAPSRENTHYLKQGSEFEGKAEELDGRDIIVFELIEAGQSKVDETNLTGEQQLSLRSEFDVAADDFEVILIGKDGTVKLREKQPVLSSDLFALIDGMPMRIEEMRSKQSRPSN